MEERLDKSVKSDIGCFGIISCDDDNDCVLNDVAVESVKEKVSVDCESYKRDENEQCDQSVQ